MPFASPCKHLEGGGVIASLWACWVGKKEAMGLEALGLIERLDNCKYSFFLGAVGPAWHGHSCKAAHPQNAVYS